MQKRLYHLLKINTPEQRKDLSLAYSQVLGIQKYEDLKNELVRIQMTIERHLLNLKRNMI